MSKKNEFREVKDYEIREIQVELAYLVMQQEASKVRPLECRTK